MDGSVWDRCPADANAVERKNQDSKDKCHDRSIHRGVDKFVRVGGGGGGRAIVYGSF